VTPRLEKGPDGALLRAGALALAVVLVLLLDLVPIASNDLWLQVKVGELIVRDGSIPRTLLFPFVAADNPFNAHEWLPSIVFHLLATALGDVDRLMLVQGALGLALFGLCFALARRLSGSFGAALVLALAAQGIANFRFVMRPELFALFLLVALLAVLTRYRDERRPFTLAWIFPIALLWANCHGSFVLAPLVAGLFAAGEALQAALAARGETPATRLRAACRYSAPYAAAAVLALLASLLNPRGAGLLRFATDVQGSGAIRSMIKEWLPTLHPLFVATPAFRIFVAAAAALVAVLVALRRHVTATDLLLVALFGGLALQRNRHVVWFGFAMLVVVAGLIGRARVDGRTERRLCFGALALALGGTLACLAWGNVRGDHPYASASNNFTRPMIAQLADPALHGNVFNSYELGAELIYRDWPRLKPSIDSRVDSYGDDYFLLHLRSLHDEGLLVAFLDAWHVNHMLLTWRDFDHDVRAMPRIAAAWHVRASDAKMLLLERNVALPDLAGGSGVAAGSAGAASAGAPAASGAAR
jgi:hypothetical protein